KVETRVSASVTGGTRHDRLASLGAQALLDTVDALAAGTPLETVQDDALATYAHKLNKDEARIDWTLPATVLERRIRAFNPWPVCHSSLQGAAVKILAASVADGFAEQQAAAGTLLEASRDGLTVACGEGALRLTRLPLAGGKPVAVADLFNSSRVQFQPGLVFG